MSNIFKRLKISIERAAFLSNLCTETYLREFKNNSELKNDNKKKDVVDILWEVREQCQNAQEDMYVCYRIGQIHTNVSNMICNQVSVSDILKSFFKF